MSLQFSNDQDVVENYLELSEGFEKMYKGREELGKFLENQNSIAKENGNVSNSRRFHVKV